MPITTPRKLDVIVLTSPSATFQVAQEQGLDTQVETLVDGPAGHPAPMFVSTKNAKPMWTFTTSEIDVLAANIPAWGINPSVTAYEKLSAGTAPVSRTAASHWKSLLTQTITYWSKISLPMREKATAEVTVCSIYDGTHEPVIETGSVALAGTLSTPNFFAAGPAWVTDNTSPTPVVTSIPSIDSIDIESGCQFRSDGDCSSIYDGYGEVAIKSTEITIKSKTALNITTWPIRGTPLTAFRFFAKAFFNGADFYANSAAQHVKFSGTVGMLYPMNKRSQGQELYADTFKIVAVSPDGVTPPIVMTTLQAIA